MKASAYKKATRLEGGPRRRSVYAIFCGYPPDIRDWLVYSPEKGLFPSDIKNSAIKKSDFNPSLGVQTFYIFLLGSEFNFTTQHFSSNCFIYIYKKSKLTYLSLQLFKFEELQVRHWIGKLENNRKFFRIVKKLGK